MCVADYFVMPHAHKLAIRYLLSSAFLSPCNINKALTMFNIETAHDDKYSCLDLHVAIFVMYLWTD